MTSYRDLRVWKEAIELVAVVYKVSESFPASERFGLQTQLRKAAISIPSNIAEGQGKMSKGEWKQSLGHARGSLYELETQIIVAESLSFIAPADAATILARTSGIGKALRGLIEYVSSNR